MDTNDMRQLTDPTQAGKDTGQYAYYAVEQARERQRREIHSRAKFRSEENRRALYCRAGLRRPRHRRTAYSRVGHRRAGHKRTGSHEHRTQGHDIEEGRTPE